MRAKIAAWLLSGALIAGAQGMAAAQGMGPAQGMAAAKGSNVVWQNPMLRVTERLQPLEITFRNRIGRAIRYRCRFLLDSDWHTARGRLGPWQVLVTLPADGMTASQFSCRTRLAG